MKSDSTDNGDGDQWSLTREEMIIAIKGNLKDLGLTPEGLKAQAEAGWFESPDAAWMWKYVRDFGLAP